MIQIDDAGSGSLIGGTVIGIFNTENKQYFYDIVPLEYYQTELFKEKAYQDYVITIIKKGLKKVKATPKDGIEVCQGYMFDKLRTWLTDQGYNWSNSRIEGELQQRVEESFNQYVIRLGLPKDFVKHARFAFGFHRLLKWVFADLEERKKLCKTQWKSWQKWGYMDKSIYPNQLGYQDFCLKCGSRLTPPLDVITIEYTTTKPATINLHPDCYTGQMRIAPPSFLEEFEAKIKKPKHHTPSLQAHDQLVLKNLSNQAIIVDGQDKIVGYLKKNIGEKLAFWISQGFMWKCYLQEENEGELILALKLS